MKPLLPSFLTQVSRLARFAGRGAGTAPCHPLDRPLVRLGPHDALSANDCEEGIVIMGATGSGKTTGSGATILRSYLQAGFGGLVLCAKPGEYEFVRALAREAGREIIRFAPEEARWRFNPLSYEVARSTRGAGIVTNVVALLLEALEAGSRGGGNHRDDAYFRDALIELLTCAAHLAMLARGTVQLGDLHRIIQSAPQSPADLDPKTPWMGQSECFAMLLEAGKKARAASEAAFADYSITEDYFLKTFPGIHEKTRGIIVNSFTALTSPMLRSPMRELFCTDTTIDPTACERGAVIVVDLPVKLYGACGAFAQVLWKMAFQKAMEQRDITKSPVPTFLWIDECQFFVSGYDTSFCSTARSARVCTTMLTQNLPGLYDALGRDKGGEHKADALLGNLTTKIWHANADRVTNQYAADTIAQTWTLKRSANQGTSSNMSQSAGDLNRDTQTNVNLSENSGSSVQEQLAHQVQPQEFTALRTGGPRNGLEVDGIVFKPGRVWNATGTNYMRVTFQQK